MIKNQNCYFKVNIQPIIRFLCLKINDKVCWRVKTFITQVYLASLRQIYLNKNQKELPVNQSLKVLSVKKSKFLKNFQPKTVFSDQFSAIFLPISANSHTAWASLRSDSNQVHSTAVVHSESTSAQQKQNKQCRKYQKIPSNCCAMEIMERQWQQLWPPIYVTVRLLTSKLFVLMDRHGPTA